MEDDSSIKASAVMEAEVVGRERMTPPGSPPPPHARTKLRSASNDATFYSASGSASGLQVDADAEDASVDPPKSPKPEMKVAKNFQRNVVRPRYEKEVMPNGKVNYRRKEPGDEGGHLYSIWKTPLEQLGDFGMGVGLYYHLVACTTVILVVAGLMNSWTISYFKSSDYDPTHQQGATSIQEGSAICTNIVTVCLDVNCTETGQIRDCPVSLLQGFLDYFTIWFILAAFISVQLYQQKKVEAIDLGEQTAQDYSVVVQDPTPEATDPEEWREFFSRFGHVTYVTVALNNGELLRHLTIKRNIVHSIKLETGMEGLYKKAINSRADLIREAPLPRWREILQKLGLMTDVYYWHDKLCREQEVIDNLKQVEYKACKVYIVFETEEGQRNCLEQMTTGLIPALLEVSSKITEDLKFRGTNVLKVEESCEPSEIIWTNQSYGLFYRLGEQTFTFVLSCALIAVSAVIIWQLSKDDPAGAAIFISISNAVLPIIIKLMTAFEHHLTDSSQQASLMLKIIIFMWTNTAIIIYITKDFSEMLTQEYIGQVSKILWADAFTTPILTLIDIPGKLNQWILARRADNQLKMNQYFVGSSWFLCERYAALVKTVFVTMFFSTLLPQGYYIAAAGQFVTYWVNKYCLLRVWRVPPPLNDGLTKLAMGYLMLAVIFKIMVSSQYYGAWPGDEYCEEPNLVVTAPAIDRPAGVLLGDPVYYACDTNPGGGPWMVERNEDWMTLHQMTLVLLFSITSIVLTVAISLAYFGRTAAMSIYRLFEGVYKPVGSSQGKPFSAEESIEAYIPQVVIARIPHPILAVNIETLNPDHISWTGDFGHFNLCSDLDLPSMSVEERLTKFSPCVNYPPTGKDEMEAPAEPLTPVPL